MTKNTIMLAAALMTMAASAVSVTGVTAKQRWPWNNLVDVDFTVDAPAGEVYRVVLDAECAGGAKKFSAVTFASDPTAAKGANRVTWDFGADYPNVRAEDMRVKVSLAPYSEAMPVYMKIDLSGGPTATKYPVTYSFTGPAHVQGATDEPCQTTELWLRRIRHYEGAMPFHYWGYSSSSVSSFYGKLTNDYYIGVFELTQRQYELVMDTNPSFFSNRTCYASRPVESINGTLLYGGNYNIQRHPENIKAASFFGKLRSKTGLPLSVPSSMQFEYALRGGYYTGEYYRYKIYDESGVLKNPNAVDIGRWSTNAETSSPTGDSDVASGTAAVGSYLPNILGLYDTMGNVYELTCEYVQNWNQREMAVDLGILRTDAGDETLGKTADNPVIEYYGQNTSGSCWRTMGGSYGKASTLSLWGEGWYMHQLLDNGSSQVGVRISMNVQ